MADMQTQAAQTAEGCGDMRGTLPACAPLANPYVPFQGQNPDRYTAGRALMKGTLFLCQFLGVIEHFILKSGRKNDGCSIDGSCQTTTTGLITTGFYQVFM